MIKFSTIRNLLKRAKIDYRFKRIYAQFENYTMLNQSNYVENLRLCNQIENIEGSIVECGTWKGGMIAGIAAYLGDERNYFLYDSFEGLPPAKEIDGQSAIDWQKDVNSPIYFDNCAADINAAKQAMKISGVENYVINKGWFEDTTPQYSGEPIALLRLDGDWYESTITCLNNLYPYVSKGGIVVIDDYREWDGCARAIHDYLSKYSFPDRIYQLNNKVSYILKT